MVVATEVIVVVWNHVGVHASWRYVGYARRLAESDIGAGIRIGFIGILVDARIAIGRYVVLLCVMMRLVGTRILSFLKREFLSEQLFEIIHNINEPSFTGLPVLQGLKAVNDVGMRCCL